MSIYITTNIRLPREDLRRLKFAAVEEDRSVSALMRDMVRRYVGTPYELRRKRRPITELKKLTVPTRQKRLSLQVDKIVYGT
jgi:hypothetical protein